MFTIEIEGETGRTWRYQLRDRLDASGDHYRAKADDGSQACIRVCEIGTFWDDEIERLRTAISVARRPEVIATPTIRHLLDVAEVAPQESEFGLIPGRLALIWEWGKYTLHEYMHGDYPQPADEVAVDVEGSIADALCALHGIGLVHLDVAPNNIMLVGATWKLADLDTCAERGSDSMRQPIDQRWLHPDRKVGRPVPARDEFDWYGLERILELLRGEQGGRAKGTRLPRFPGASPLPGPSLPEGIGRGQLPALTIRAWWRSRSATTSSMATATCGASCGWERRRSSSEAAARRSSSRSSTA